jgi:hypothetical protein
MIGDQWQNAKENNVANWVGDLSQQIVSGSLFATSTGVSTDANAAGVSVDLASNVGNIITAVQVVGGLAGTGTPTLASKVQESTDGTNNWTDVTGGGFTAVTTTSNVQAIGIKPTKRYVRTTGTVAGTSPVAEATTLIYAPRRTAPDNDGGFDQTAAAGN